MLAEEIAESLRRCSREADVFVHMECVDAIPGNLAVVCQGGENLILRGGGGKYHIDAVLDSKECENTLFYVAGGRCAHLGSRFVNIDFQKIFLKGFHIKLTPVI